MNGAQAETGGAALSIDIERLKRDLLALARFGADPARPGINRPSFSDADMAARRWLLAEMEALGLAARMDGAGNVIGRWEVGDGPAVLSGSHLDSVPQGGLFDGALGVCAALECLRVLKESGRRPGCPLEVVATSEEEGRFGGMFGAQALCGLVTREWLENARDESGLRLADAMRAQGLDPLAALEAGRAAGDLKAFLELHIEQGPVLEREGLAIGIVEGISGVFNWSVTLKGEANHAGTTPMELRRDAFQGLAQVAQSLSGIIERVGGPQSRLTIGQVELLPGYPHTVPGEARFSLIGRDLDERVMQHLASACRESIAAAAEAHGLEQAVEEQSWLAPSLCSASIVEMLQRQAEKLELSAVVMPSGAGHDTQFLAGLTQAGLIFVPSRGGVSHAPDEWTDWPEIERGANLLLHAIMELSGVEG